MEHKDGNGKNSLINNRWGSVCVCGSHSDDATLAKLHLFKMVNFILVLTVVVVAGVF